MSKDGWKSPLLVESQPENPWSRKVYAFRNHFLREFRKGNRCIMLSSCWPGEGKSSLTANLAASLTQMALRVVLVDADLAKPTLSAMFGLRNNPGVLEILDGEQHQPVGVTHHAFSLLPAGQTRAMVRPALRRQQVSDLFAELKTKYDCVLVDSTALSINSDAISFGVGADGCLLVVRGQAFQGIPEGHLLEDLREAGVSVLGALING